MMMMLMNMIDMLLNVKNNKIGLSVCFYDSTATNKTPKVTISQTSAPNLHQ